MIMQLWMQIMSTKENEVGGRRGDFACDSNFEFNIKGARSDCFSFFQSFGDFGIRRKLIIIMFLITPEEFYS